MLNACVLPLRVEPVVVTNPDTPPGAPPSPLHFFVFDATRIDPSIPWYKLVEHHTVYAPLSRGIAARALVTVERAVERITTHGYLSMINLSLLAYFHERRGPMVMWGIDRDCTVKALPPHIYVGPPCHSAFRLYSDPSSIDEVNKEITRDQFHLLNGIVKQRLDVYRFIQAHQRIGKPGGTPWAKVPTRLFDFFFVLSDASRKSDILSFWLIFYALRSGVLPTQTTSELVLLPRHKAIVDTRQIEFKRWHHIETALASARLRSSACRLTTRFAYHHKYGSPAAPVMAKPLGEYANRLSRLHGAGVGCSLQNMFGAPHQWLVSAPFEAFLCPISMQRDDAVDSKAGAPHPPRPALATRAEANGYSLSRRRGVFYRDGFGYARFDDLTYFIICVWYKKWLSTAIVGAIPKIEAFTPAPPAALPFNKRDHDRAIKKLARDKAKAFPARGWEVQIKEWEEATRNNENQCYDIESIRIAMPGCMRSMIGVHLTFQLRGIFAAFMFRSGIGITDFLRIVEPGMRSKDKSDSYWHTESKSFAELFHSRRWEYQHNYCSGLLKLGLCKPGPHVPLDQPTPKYPPAVPPIGFAKKNCAAALGHADIMFKSPIDIMTNIHIRRTRPYIPLRYEPDEEHKSTAAAASPAAAAAAASYPSFSDV